MTISMLSSFPLGGCLSLQEFAEATAEEAGKKFKDLHLGSTIASSTSPKPTVCIKISVP
jgi:hypothetical protein